MSKKSAIKSKSSSTSLIIGFGEIGQSLYEVLKNHYFLEVSDITIKSEPLSRDVDVMHICFPFSEDPKKFIGWVKQYQKKYNPKYTVIHSTVPLGITRKCNAFFSPCRGIHPFLEKSLTTFVKYLAPKNNYLKKYFEKAGIKIELVAKPKTLEAMKLYCTTIYGLNIIAEKEIYNFCKKHGLDYKIVYEDCNRTYNDGYEKLGFPQFKKYLLKHYTGKIGGHCIVPNCKLLNTPVANFILKNDKW